MIDWTKGYHADFELVGLKVADMRERAIEGKLLGGNITRNYNTQIKESAQLDTLNYAADSNDVLRIYYIVQQGKNRERIPLGTFLVETPTQTRYGSHSTTRVDCYSMLHLPASYEYGKVTTINRGRNTLEAATKYLHTAGISGSMRTISGSNSHKLTAARTYEKNTNCLTIANDLLSVINYAGASVDGLGRVHLKPYVSPSGKSPVVTFGKDMIYSLEIIDSEDWYDTPNLYAVVCTNQDRTLYAAAQNWDENSRTSIINRGRIISKIEEVQDISSQTALNALAKRKLDEAGDPRKITIEHPFNPAVNIGEVVAIDTEGLQAKGVVQEMRMTLEAGIITTTTMRVIE